MHNTKYMYLMMLVLSITLVLTGCGGSKEKDKDTTQAETTSYEIIIEEGKMVVGLDEDSFPPMGFWDEN